MELFRPERNAHVVLENLERMFGGREEDPLQGGPDPDRACDAAGDIDDSRLAAIDPRRRHRAAELLEHRARRAERVGQREDRRRVDRHLRSFTLEAVPLEDLLGVDDDPVVDADYLAVTHGVVVGLDRRMALRVVAYVDEYVGGV